MTLAVIAIWLVAVVFARISSRSWSSPGCTLSLVFTTSVAGAALLAPAYHISLAANFYLVIVSLATTLGSMLGEKPANLRTRPVSHTTISRRSGFISYGYICSGISLVATLRAVGLSPSALISPTRLAKGVQVATHERYTVGLSFPLYYNIANAMVLAYAIIVAMEMTEKRRLDAALLPPIVIFIIANLVITTRAPLIFMTLMMGFASFYTRQALIRAGLVQRLSAVRIIRTVVVVGGFVVGIFYLFEQLRFGSNNVQSSSQIWIHIRKWPFGSVPAFSAWYDSGRPQFVQNPPGDYTFMGIYDTLGIAARQVGTFADYTYLTPTESTNVYTVFRGMIADYGRIGTVFVMLCLGFVGNAAASRWLFSRNVGLALFVGVYTYIAFSLFSSYWAYTSNILAILLIGPLIKLFCSDGRTERRRRSNSSRP